MNDLVRRLSERPQSVMVGGPQPSLKDFQQRVEWLGYVFIKFTETQGGTDLGIRVDRSATTTDHAQFEQGKGMVHVEGSLTLNYVPVRCVADIDLSTLRGTGQLVVIEEALHS